MYFIKAQQSDNRWHLYVLTLFIYVFTYLVVGIIPLGVVLAVKMAGEGGVDLQGFLETYNTELLGIGQNPGLILLLFPAVISFFVLLLLMINLHKRRLGDIASAEGKIRRERLITGSVVWLMLLVIAEVIFYKIDPDNYEYLFDLRKFLPLVVISFVIIPWQAWSEELFFRSYLMVGFGLLFRIRFLALLITSAAFGLLHFSNPEVREFGFWVTMPYYIAFGLFAGLLVIFDDGIELACGIHAINNIYGSVLVTYESSVITTPAVWKMKTVNPVTTIGGFLVIAVIFIVIMARRYKWENWRKLFAPIPRKNNEQTELS
ncbi:MAG: CPBP family intramembrane metalloprotease [Bacteroidales bacterium]|jgi:membrane protease YdiL (CAAX protease family)